MIEDWYRRRSDEVQTAFDVLREYLEQRPRDEWRRPDFDLLSGKPFWGPPAGDAILSCSGSRGGRRGRGMGGDDHRLNHRLDPAFGQDQRA